MDDTGDFAGHQQVIRIKSAARHITYYPSGFKKTWGGAGNVSLP
jgi:hypothetical protein